jgi:uroporphyrinogen-III synthase
VRRERGVTATLAGARVLVTRPAEQARGLARRIEAEGGEAILFPVLAIEPVGDLDAVRAGIGPLERYDLVIFVSPNAVAHGRALLRLSATRAPSIAAIGPSTAHALEAAGATVAIRPAAGYTSEALLAEPALNVLQGRRVLVVRGVGGRELIADTLKARGAEVVYAEVYRRVATRSDAGALRATWMREGMDFVTVLSLETLDALLARLEGEGPTLLARTALVTASGRVLKRAAALGLRDIVMAEGPDDAALVAAMIAWRRARSQ